MKSLFSRSLDHLFEGNGFGAPYGAPLALECAFTEAYRQHEHSPVAERELAGMTIMFPAILQPLGGGDLLAGRIRYPLVGQSPEPMGLGYYCCHGALQQVAEHEGFTVDVREQARQLSDYWATRTTGAKTRAAFPRDMAGALPRDNFIQERAAAYPLYRMGGSTLDYGKLLQLGLPGLRADLATRKSGADDKAIRLYESMEGALDVLAAGLRMYAAQARQLALTASEQREAELLALAGALEAVREQPPGTFLEAMQLFWLYALQSGTWNYGRMDVYLGPFLVRDIAAGRLDESRALMLVRSLWRLIADYDNMYNLSLIHI